MERAQPAHFVRIFFVLRARLVRNRPFIIANPDWRACMKKAVFAGAVAVAMLGPLLGSEHGFGPAPAAAQDVVVTEGKIARLRAALRLTGEQLQHWHPVEAALRAAIREQREGEGWVRTERNHVGVYAGGAMALQRAR